MGSPSYQEPEVEGDLDDDKKEAKKVRSALLETEGGIGGEEVMGDGTSKRNTLFGN